MLVLVIILVLVVGVVFPRVGELRFDYLGVLVTIFSAMITLLIGWQISSFMSHKKDVEDKVKDMSDRIDDIDDINDKIADCLTLLIERGDNMIAGIADKDTLTQAELYVNLSMSYCSSGKDDIAIMTLFLGIQHCFGRKKRDENFDNILNTIKYVMNSIPTTTKLQEGQIDWIKGIADNSNNPDIQDYVKKLEANQIKSED